jgi:hypothetical protein
MRGSRTFRFFTSTNNYASKTFSTVMLKFSLMLEFIFRRFDEKKTDFARVEMKITLKISLHSEKKLIHFGILTL